jgi:hypothetical protein
MTDNTVYLGDGLYAKFENMQIALMSNDPQNPSDTVYIEWPEIWDALTSFVKRTISEVYDASD